MSKKTSWKFKIVSLLLIVVFNCNLLFAQNLKSDSSLLVNVEVIAEDGLFPPRCSSLSPRYEAKQEPLPQPEFKDFPPLKAYFTKIILSNRTDTVVKIWIMSESWQIDNFITDKDSLFFIYPGNDMNGPTEMQIMPRTSANFYAVLCSPEQSSIENFKVAFLNYTKDEIYSHWLLNYRKRDKMKVERKYWSKDTQLRPRLNRYILE